MDFYNYSCKDIKKEISEFSKGSFGKTIFLLAFSPALILLMVAITIEIFGIPNGVICEYAPSLPFWILAVMISFIFGNMYYYSELRKYMEHKSAKQKDVSKKKGSAKTNIKSKTKNNN